MITLTMEKQLGKTIILVFTVEAQMRNFHSTVSTWKLNE